jgi:hypothetical protein
MPSKVRYSTFPRTEVPPAFVAKIVEVFRVHEPAIGTMDLDKGLTSDTVLARMREDFMSLGFSVETGKLASDKIKRPVFFGENATPDLQYEIDAFHSDWRCGLEVEAGRAWMGMSLVARSICAVMIGRNVAPDTFATR